MSTKTTFKRIALVTVAALGLGVVATVPSQATVSANSLTLSAATSTQLTDETSTASAAVATLSFLNTNVGDTVSVTAYLMSAPAGNTKTPVLQVVETASAKVATTVARLATNVEPVGGENTTQVAYVTGTADLAAVTAKFKVYMNSATKAGAYVIKLVPAVAGGGGVIDTTGVTLTITVSTNPATDTVATTSTSVITTYTDSTTTTDNVVTASKVVPATGTNVPVALIKTTLKNAAAATVTAESYTAVVVTGPGLLGSAALGATAPNNAPAGRAIAVKNGDIVTIHPDGASGVSTIQIQSAAGIVLSTKTVTFFGDATAATATVVKPIINATGTQKAILVTLKDAAGTNVSSAQVFYVSSSDTAKVSGAYAATASTSYLTKNLAADGVTNLGAGYLVELTGVAAGTASITVGTKSSATATTGVNAAAVSVRVGSATPASVTVSLDKTSYAPGEKATLSVVLKDATGLALADGTYAGVFATGGIVAGYTLGTGSDSITGTAVTMVSGVAEYTIYMPISEKDVKFSWKTGTTTLTTANQGVSGSVTAAFSSSAIEAANAATTAALAANDAVDALAATVAKLVAGLKAQITALTKLIVKIQKKVRA